HDKSKRFQRVNAHEMYNMGHLLTAACVHFRSTGKENFMGVAIKNADFLYNQWKTEGKKMSRYPWNPSVFMGMAEMYRTTHNLKYLELLQIMVDNRGSNPNPDRDHSMGGTDQTQDRVPLRQDSVAVGHAVTGNYFYCGAADLYAETGDKSLLDALERIWNDIHHKKIDIVCGVAMGGQGHEISPRGDEVHESFANKPYMQPNLYNETCANIGTGMFNYRMFMLTGDPKYTDWTERMMYNTLNSGVDLQGEHWFYANPLSWDGTEGEKMKQGNGRDKNRLVPAHHSGLRWEYMNCYCCPPSVTRTTAKIHNWFYNISDDGALWVNFYGGNQLSTTLADGSEIALTQVTQYPWEGLVKIKIDKVDNKFVPIHFRIPNWTENPVVSINNEKLSVQPKPGSYVKIEHEWKAGDEITLDFPMPIRLMEANPKATKLNNKVAVMRGPVVYCMELPKQEGGEALFQKGIFLTEDIKLTEEYRSDFLGGVTVLKVKALTLEEKEDFVKSGAVAKNTNTSTWKGEELYRPMNRTQVEYGATGSVDVELIPYYAWANRGLAYMDVWIPLAR
ncbi:MAG: glycoside hydrolase family 127 protein, partial [Maribacter sp.]|nr:glycoside hydrolase family 127 protein [Maribacter sp.]